MNSVNDNAIQWCWISSVKYPFSTSINFKEHRIKIELNLWSISSSIVFVKRFLVYCMYSLLCEWCFDCCDCFFDCCCRCCCCIRFLWLLKRTNECAQQQWQNDFARRKHHAHSCLDVYQVSCFCCSKSYTRKCVLP